MDVVLSFLQHILTFNMFMYFAVSSEILARIAMGAASAFKKSKNRLKKENAQRPLVYKIFGSYALSNTHAPHHMKKYAIIRICNLISFIFAVVLKFCLPDAPVLQTLFSVLAALHILFLFMPLVVDALILSDLKKYGKMPNFDLSRRP